MNAKPLFALGSGMAETALAPAGPANAFEGVVRRLAGDGALSLLRAKAEVISTLRANAGEVPYAAPIEDALPAPLVPSVAAGCEEDRVLAEIDQDGFAFATDPRDEPFFNRRAHRVQRQMNLVDVVLLQGRVCVRKRFRGFRFGARRWGDRPVPAGDRVRRSLWTHLGLFLYTEAAALLRLRDVPFVPKLRAIDLVDRALYLDYLQGDSLRAIAARGGAAVHDGDLARDPLLSQLPARDLERREVALLEGAAGGGFRAEVAGMVREVNARGVAPLDIKLGNFVRGAATGRLYWIDFEVSRLSSQPRWEADLAVQRETFEQVFELSAHGHSLQL